MNTASATRSFGLELSMRNGRARVSYINAAGVRATVTWTPQADSSRELVAEAEALLAERGVEVGSDWTFSGSVLRATGRR